MVRKFNHMNVREVRHKNGERSQAHETHTALDEIESSCHLKFADKI